MPEPIAVITPAEVIVATDVFDDVQVPPDILAVTVSVLPAQVAVSPAKESEQVVTAIAFVVKQPEGRVYVIVADPEEIPFITPVTLSIVATDWAEEVQVPPVVAV